MDRIAVITVLADNITYYIEAAQKERGLNDEDINLAIRWAMIKSGVQDSHKEEDVLDIKVKHLGDMIDKLYEKMDSYQYHLEFVQHDIHYLKQDVYQLGKNMDRTAKGDR